jgi:hypothetical protein
MPKARRSRQAALARTFGFVDAGAGNEYVKVGLEGFLNRILQGEPVGCGLLRRADRACEYGGQREKSYFEEARFHDAFFLPETAIDLQKC